jgi:hypothetical protein
MTTDNVNHKTRKRQDISWEVLIRESEARILENQRQTKELRKSIVFFNKQKEAGVPFPPVESIKVRKIS